MEEKETLIIETAWNVYRAFRTYDGPKKAMEGARAVLPSTPERTEYALAAVSHARAIVLSFRLDAPTGDDDFNRRGINILTECISHEIETSAEATRSKCDEWYKRDFIRYNDGQLTPIIGSIHDYTKIFYTPALYPYIALNLSVFDSRDAFIQHVNTVLPDMYDRLTSEVANRTATYWNATLRASEEWQRQALPSNTPKKVADIVKERGIGALFGHLKNDGWKDWEARKRAYDPDSIADVPKYHGPTPAGNPESGLTEEEWQFYWHFCVSEPDGTCRVHLPQIAIGPDRVAAPTRQLRGRYFRERKRTLTDFHRHTEWWIASRLEDKSYRQIAKDEGIASHTTVSKAIRRIEEDFRVA